MSRRLHPFARLLIAAIGLAAVQVLAVLLVTAIYAALTHASFPGESRAQTLSRAIGFVNTNALSLTLFTYPLNLLWLGFCRAKLDRRSFLSLGLRAPRLVPNLIRGALGGVLAIGVLWSILWLTGALAVGGFSEAARAAGARSVFPLAGWAIAFAAVGFMEEVTFRGYALQNLTNWLGWKGAVAVQAAVFAVIHLANVATAPKDAQLAAVGALPSLFLVAVFFALCYRKTGSLWFPIGFHAAWNFSLGCLFSLPVSGIDTFKLLDVQSSSQSWFSGGSFGAEGSFVLIPVLLAAIYVLLQAPDHPQALLDLGLIERPAPQVVRAPQIVETPAEWEEADDPNRENRFRTKFGTSEGFDEGMLRELRSLQQQREEKEAQARREAEVLQQTAVEVELLRPVAPATESEAVAVTVAEEPAPIAEAVAPVAQTKAVALEKVEPPTPDAPMMAAKPRRSVVFAPRTEAPASSSPAPEVEVAPVETPAPVENEEAPVEVATPAPVVPKKAAPRW